ncbi:MAG: O-antigen ligase family protein [Candidatus Uhrbacteria bacterium]|nr:O-antigen ligase family protein [Candidatus Uhrbacteria bacterium]
MITTKRLYTILGALCGLILITPILFFPLYIQAMSTAKVIVFLFLTQLALPVYLAILFQKKEPWSVFRQPIILTFAAFILTLIVSSIFGIDPLNSFVGTIQRPVSVLLFIHGFLVVLYLHELFTYHERWKRTCTNILIAIATLIAFYALFEGWLLPSVVSQEGRVASVLGNPIFLASFLTLPLFFSLARACDRADKHKNLFRLASTIMGGAILLTGTRGALVGLVAGGVFWFVAHIITHRTSLKPFLTKSFAVIGIGIALFFAIVTFAPEQLGLSRLIQLGDTNVSSRLAYWEMGLRGWQETPVLGLGPGNFYRLADQMFTEETYDSSTTWPDKPHNIAIEWLATTGIIGFGLYLALLVLLYRQGLRHLPVTHRLILLTGLTAYVIQGQFVFHTFSELLTFLFLVAFISAVPELTQKHAAHAVYGSTQAFWMGSVVTLIGILTYVLPYHTLAYTVGAGQSFLQHDPQTAFTHLQSAASQRIILDDTLIANKYVLLVQSFVRTSSLEKNVVDEAIRQHQVSTRLHPLRARVWSDLGFLFYLKATIQDAPVAQEGMDAAVRATELAPQRFEPKRVLALISLRNGNILEAKTIVESLLESFPDTPSLYLILSEIAFKQGDLALTAEYGYRGTLREIQSASKEQVLWVAELLVAQAEYEKIIELYEAWLEKNPEDPSLLANLAATYATIGQTQNAIDSATRLKELDPTMTEQADAFIESLN